MQAGRGYNGGGAVTDYYSHGPKRKRKDNNNNNNNMPANYIIFSEAPIFLSHKLAGRTTSGGIFRFIVVAPVH